MRIQGWIRGPVGLWFIGCKMNKTGQNDSKFFSNILDIIFKFTVILLRFLHFSLRQTKRQQALILITASLLGCYHKPHNDPYHTEDATANIYYGAYSSAPKTLDPAKAYTTDEAQFVSLVYETPLQYQYLTRPWALEPLLATRMPEVVYKDAQGNVTSDPRLAKCSEYTIHIQPGVYYQPHPAFARSQQGGYLYWPLSADAAQAYQQISDFKYTATREVTAEDFVYEIKRLASPAVQSPIYGLMSEHIQGLSTLREEIEQSRSVDLRAYPFAGATVIDKYTYRIDLKDPYPQFIYWLAMSFFAPYPWEADQFYQNPGFADRNLSIDWVPIGTGPYEFVRNNPNQSLQLIRNTNFHGEKVPAGLAARPGKHIPYIDRIEFYLEKEAIPTWNKFLQGYYDQSGIASDTFDQAISYNAQRQPIVSPKLQKKGITLQISTSPTIFYLGFNQLDPVVGGSSAAAQKLRQALSIAVDMNEYIKLFLNGRGEVAQSPLPPGIFGARTGQAGIDPVIFQWQNNQIKRRPLSDAQKLLSEAGYPNGIDVKTGRPLALTLSIMSESNIDEGTLYAWFRQQFAKLNIELNIDSTTYSRFQDKLQNGSTQLFFSGWIADYPDPENFLFLLYGPNAKVEHNGENVANYNNAQFDAWYQAMARMPNGPERQALIDKMVQQVQEDAPWIWGFYPVSYQLSHAWVLDSYANPLMSNTLKYMRILPEIRYQARVAWNPISKWPIILIVLGLFIFIVVAVFAYRKINQRRVSIL